MNKVKRYGLAARLAIGLWAISAASQGLATQLATATFAAGCFWCLEKPFDKLDGVHSTVSGYIGGHKHKPTYRQVSAGTTGHTEAVQVSYDPALVSYEQLLAVFWRNVDPFDGKGQFCDKGSQYRPGIFFHDQAQKQAALASLGQVSDGALKAQLAAGEKIAVELTMASRFYPAEDYHQDYYQKNPVRYNYYRYRCGRDARLEQVWGAAPDKP